MIAEGKLTVAPRNAADKFPCKMWSCAASIGRVVEKQANDVQPCMHAVERPCPPIPSPVVLTAVGCGRARQPAGRPPGSRAFHILITKQWKCATSLQAFMPSSCLPLPTGKVDAEPDLLIARNAGARGYASLGRQSTHDSNMRVPAWSCNPAAVPYKSWHGEALLLAGTQNYFLCEEHLIRKKMNTN